MSIINDAIKKARKEFEKGSENTVDNGSGNLSGERPVERSERTETKWTAMMVVSLVLIASLLGAIFLYKHLAGLKIDTPPSATTVKLGAPVTFSDANQKAAFPGARFEDVVELNGIVYGPEEKWAIINDKIVREGDSLLGGAVTLIEKDFVKIKRDNGEEMVLNLR